MILTISAGKTGHKLSNIKQLVVIHKSLGKTSFCSRKEDPMDK